MFPFTKLLNYTQDEMIVELNESFFPFAYILYFICDLIYLEFTIL